MVVGVIRSRGTLKYNILTGNTNAYSMYAIFLQNDSSIHWSARANTNSYDESPEDGRADE
jgi:hypothetical protein